MENINDILKGQLQNPNGSQQNTNFDYRPSLKKKKSKVKPILITFGICILAIGLFFVYKIARVNIAFSNVRNELKASNNELSSISNAEYILSNLNYPIIIDDQDDVKYLTSKAYDEVVKHANSFDELKKYYERSKNHLDEDTVTYNFVVYSLNNKLTDDEINYICNEIDECAQQKFSWEDELESDLENKNKIISLKRFDIYLNKYYVMYFQSHDTSEVKQEILSFIQTELKMSDSDANDYFMGCVQEGIDRYESLYDIE